MKKKHTLSALVENKFGVLARVAGMLSGRGFNIETLNVGPTHDPAYSRITATVVADEAALERAIEELLADPARRQLMGRRAAEVVRANQGGLEKTVQMILSAIEG